MASFVLFVAKIPDKANKMTQEERPEANSAPGTDIPDVVRQARNLLQAGDHARAMNLLRGLDETERTAEAWFLLGALCGQGGRFDEARACLMQAIHLEPERADAHFNLAQLYMHRRDFREAIASYRTVLRLQPENIVAIGNLGYAAHEAGAFEESIACHRRALAMRPGDPATHNNLGNALWGAGKRDEALDAYRAAVAADPAAADAYSNMARLLQKMGRVGEALAACEAALRARPGHVSAWLARAGIRSSQGCAQEADADFRKAIELAPDSELASSGRLFNMNYFAHDPHALFRAHADAGATLARRYPAARHHANDRSPDRPLRIGYLSADFRRHSVACFFEPVIAGHDPARIETYCYANVGKPDEVTARIRSYARCWRDISGVGTEGVVEQIRADAIDILVDLGGHTLSAFIPVLARKPAPVQVSYLGYPNTIGLPAVGFRLTDSWADPYGEADKLHVESLVRLPRGFLCYLPPPDAPPVTTRPPAACGGVTFGSFNNIAKLTPEVVALWSEILCTVPASRLMLKGELLDDADTRRHVESIFAAHGVSVERLALFPRLSRKDHFALYNEVDIALDTFPYNGTTTTCEALWMGVPVVALAGNRHAGRVGVSILNQIGCEEWVAGDPRDYVRIAVDLAETADRRARFRSGSRDRLLKSPLCDAPAFVRDLESAYRRIWQAGFATQPS
jgi:predicted O-linked N-acetylglucosamine transferase (SPINDLY family)